MSRCFPFPPPGYEKKARTNQVDLLKKEKQKEKKHKKDKRDKDKRESKEKKEKEGKDGKHKEKDKKEKHREKKKDRDKDKSRDRDKNKTGTADDKGFLGQAEGPNAGKLQKEIKQNDKKGILSENRLTKQYNGNNGEKTRENNHMVDANKDSKFLLELDRRIRDVDGGADNRLVQKFTNSDHRKDEGTVKLATKGSGTRLDGNEKLMDKSLDVKKIDGRGVWAELQPIGNAPIQNHSGNFHPRVDGMPKLLAKHSDRNFEAAVEAKEKVKEKKDEGKEKVREKTEEGKEKVKERKDEGEGKVKEKKYEGEGKVKEKKDEGKEKVKEKKDDKRGEKRKEKEKKGHGKDKDRDKDKKKEEKPKERNEAKTTEQNQLKEGNKIGPIESNYLTQVPRISHEIAVGGENLKKRKDCESNGVPRVDENRPSKFPRSSSSLPSTENGRILDAGQISIPNASDRSVIAKSVKVENKERKINGIIEAQPSAVPSNKVHTAIVPADPTYPIIEASLKPPHPDTKYLSSVYLVPKVELWSDFDDQEWLFGGSSVSQKRKAAVESSNVGETPEVWAEALHIESEDVFALPYVIPY
ncbi:hypothetical protein VNO77_01253 [Canavalia gladiata]|uniref:Myb-like protein X n=1 Tax=Canavalia gladiata TaxID=3824 RepID=A0AAN9R211_CANGL